MVHNVNVGIVNKHKYQSRSGSLLTTEDNAMRNPGILSVCDLDVIELYFI